MAASGILLAEGGESIRTMFKRNRLPDEGSAKTGVPRWLRSCRLRASNRRRDATSRTGWLVVRDSGSSHDEGRSFPTRLVYSSRNVFIGSSPAARAAGIALAIAETASKTPATQMKVMGSSGLTS